MNIFVDFWLDNLFIFLRQPPHLQICQQTPHYSYLPALHIDWPRQMLGHRVLICGHMSFLVAFQQNRRLESHAGKTLNQKLEKVRKRTYWYSTNIKVCIKVSTSQQKLLFLKSFHPFQCLHMLVPFVPFQGPGQKSSCGLCAVATFGICTSTDKSQIRAHVYSAF